MRGVLWLGSEAGLMGQEQAGQSSCRQSVSTGHLAATLELPCPSEQREERAWALPSNYH